VVHLKVHYCWSLNLKSLKVYFDLFAITTYTCKVDSVGVWLHNSMGWESSLGVLLFKNLCLVVIAAPGWFQYQLGFI
jgi:hypothetical protein